MMSLHHHVTAMRGLRQELGYLMSLRPSICNVVDEAVTIQGQGQQRYYINIIGLDCNRVWLLENCCELTRPTD